MQGGEDSLIQPTEVMEANRIAIREDVPAVQTLYRLDADAVLAISGEIRLVEEERERGLIGRPRSRRCLTGVRRELGCHSSAMRRCAPTASRGEGTSRSESPPHHVDLLTGIISSTCGNRKKKDSSDITISLREEPLRGRA